MRPRDFSINASIRSCRHCATTQLIFKSRVYSVRQLTVSVGEIFLYITSRKCQRRKMTLWWHWEWQGAFLKLGSTRTCIIVDDAKVKRDYLYSSILSKDNIVFIIISTFEILIMYIHYNWVKILGSIRTLRILVVWSNAGVLKLL